MMKFLSGSRSMGRFCPCYKITTSRGTISISIIQKRHTIPLIITSETPSRCSTSIDQKRWIYPKNMEGLEALGIKTRPVGDAKTNYISIPKDLWRMRMVLLIQNKIPISAKISRELDKVRKERYMGK